MKGMLSWMRPHLGVLAVRKVDRPLVGSDLKSMHGVPFGAGMVVRGKVAAAYLEKLEREPIRRHLDRCGKNFLGGGDRDLARTARQLDLKWAVYPTLRLTHLISKDRLDPDYFKRLWQGGMAATAILNRLDGVEADSGRRTRGSGLRGAYRALRFWKRRRMVRRLRAESKVIVKRFFETHRELLERPFTHESSRSRDS